MSLFRRSFSRRLPDRLLEISERIYVFDCCLTNSVMSENEYKSYLGGVVTSLHNYHPGASFMVFNFREGDHSSSLLSDILIDYDMAVVDYPRHYEGYPLLPLEMIHYFLRSSVSWLSLEGQKNVILMHCERGSWPVLAFMLAALLLYRKQYSGEHKTLEMVYKQAPKELFSILSPLNPRASQMRYLRYITGRDHVASDWPPSDSTLVLDYLLLRNLPLFDGGKGCRPVVRVYGQDPSAKANRSSRLLFSSLMAEEPAWQYPKEECIFVKLELHCQVKGDVFLECIHLHDDLVSEEMMFKVMFHTGFIHSNVLALNADEIDVPWNAKYKLPKDFKAEVLFHDINEGPLNVTMELGSGEDFHDSESEFFEVEEIFTPMSNSPETKVDFNGIMDDKIIDRPFYDGAEEISPFMSDSQARKVDFNSIIALEMLLDDKNKDCTLQSAIEEVFTSMSDSQEKRNVEIFTPKPESQEGKLEEIFVPISESQEGENEEIFTPMSASHEREKEEIFTPMFESQERKNEEFFITESKKEEIFTPISKSQEKKNEEIFTIMSDNQEKRNEETFTPKSDSQEKRNVEIFTPKPESQERKLEEIFTHVMESQERKNEEIFTPMSESQEKRKEEIFTAMSKIQERKVEEIFTPMSDSQEKIDEEIFTPIYDNQEKNEDIFTPMSESQERKNEEMFTAMSGIQERKIEEIFTPTSKSQEKKMEEIFTPKSESQERKYGEILTLETEEVFPLMSESQERKLDFDTIVAQERLLDGEFQDKSLHHGANFTTLSENQKKKLDFNAVLDQEIFQVDKTKECSLHNSIAQEGLLDDQDKEIVTLMSENQEMKLDFNTIIPQERLLDDKNKDCTFHNGAPRWDFEVELTEISRSIDIHIDEENQKIVSIAGSNVSGLKNIVVVDGSQTQDVKVEIERKPVPSLAKNKQKKNKWQEITSKTIKQQRVISQWVPRSKPQAPEVTKPKSPVYKWVPKGGAPGGP